MFETLEICKRGDQELKLSPESILLTKKIRARSTFILRYFDVFCVMLQWKSDV